MNTDAVSLSAFLMSISMLFFKSPSVLRSAGGKLFSGFVICTPANLNLILSRLLSKATDGCTGGSQLDLTWKECGLLSFPLNMYCKRNSSCKMVKVSFVTGVGINLSPFNTRLIFPFVDSLSERLLISFF